MDRRQEQLRRWVAMELAAPSPESLPWKTVAGDASSRRYFRVGEGEDSLICVDAPPSTEKNESFLQVRSLLEAAGLRVPALRAADSERGFMLLEDLGDELMLDRLRADTVDDFYRQALEQLLPMQAIRDPGLPPYSEAILAEELSRFSEWFCQGWLRIEPGGTKRQSIVDLEAQLIANALEQPQVFVHVDYHSRNLLLLPGGELAIIDFQDARLGPLCYDLVSLLRDCYIRWSPEQVRNWALAYRNLLLENKLPAGDDEEQFLRWFDWIGLQRHLKVLGNFTRLSLRNGKHDYLGDIPLVSDYIRQVLATYEELADFRLWYEEQVVPLIAAQLGSAGQ